MGKAVNETTANEKAVKVVYQVVSENGAELLTYAELAAKYEIIGINKNTHNRIEIQGKPKLANFLGPMYNGVNNEGLVVVRYESTAAYEMYSN